MQVCKLDNTTNDTVFLYAGFKNEIFQIDSPRTCDILSIIEDSVGCPTLQDVMRYYKSINDPNYYELLPNQQCIEIPTDNWF